MAWYRAGTVSLTNGSPNVIGANTQFVANANIGQGIELPDGRSYEIADIVSNTQLTLVTAYLGGTAAGQSYQILPFRGEAANFVLAANDLLQSFADVRDGIGTGLLPDGSFAAPGLRFSGDQDTGIYRSADNQLAIAASNGVQVSGPGVIAYRARLAQASELPIMVGSQHVNIPNNGQAGIWHREEGTGGFGQAGGLVFKVSANDQAPSAVMHLHSQGQISFGGLAALEPYRMRITSRDENATLQLRHSFAAGAAYLPATLMMGVDQNHVRLSGSGLPDNNTVGFFTVDVADVNGNLTRRLEIDFGGQVLAGSDNGQQLGSAARRWGTIYSGTGSINTSDEREKHWRGPLDDAELRAAKRIIGELGMYQWSDAVAEKGEDGARLHFGVRAQRAFAILEDEGLDWTRYAWCCRDILAQVLPGEQAPKDAPVRYGVRPDQLAFWLIAAQAAMQADLEARIAALEAA